MAKSNSDLDFDWQIAVCMGLNFTQEEAAEALGCARSTIARRIGENDRFFDVAIPFVGGLRERHIRTQVRDVVAPAESRIKTLFDRAFKLTEQLIAKAEKMGEDATIEQLMDIHKNIVVWASKFAASEAPKRISLEKHQNVHVLVMGLEDAKNLLVARGQIAVPRETLPALPAYEEAEVVPQ